MRHKKFSSQNLVTQRSSLFRYTTTLFLSLWLVYGYWFFNTVLFISRIQVVLITVPVLFLLLSLKNGAGKLTSTLGKILIALGVLSLVTLLIDQSFDAGYVDIFGRLAVLVTGIYLERISPREQLKPYMFLAIASKVQFIIIGVLFAAIGDPMGSGWIPAFFWWVVLGLMVCAIPLLAYRQRRAYRALVFATSVLAFILFLDLLFAMRHWNYMALIALTAAMWPIVTERLIGLRVFSPARPRSLS